MATKDQDPSTNDKSDKPDIDEEVPDRGKPSDDEPSVDVRTEHGKTEVDVHQESRRERREREHREERNRELEQHTAPIRQQLEETQRLLRDLSARQQPQAPAAQPKSDDDEYLKLSEEMEGVISSIRAETASGSMNPDRGKALKGKYYKLERQRSEIVAKAQLASYRPPQGPSAHEQMLANTHPDVWFNQEARTHAANIAQIETRLRQRREGRALSPGEIIEIQHASLKRAGEELGITRPSVPTPTRGERARFSGTGASSRGQGGKVTRQLADHEVEAAKAMFPDDSDNVAIEKFMRVADKNGYFKDA